MVAIARARRSRRAGKVWTPRNSTRPRIITASPINVPSRGPFAVIRVHFQRLHGNVGYWQRQWLRRRFLLIDIAVVDVADGDGPPGQGTPEVAGEFERHAGVNGIVDRL